MGRAAGQDARGGPDPRRRKLAVDGVLLIGEHGDYPLDARGRKLYPRRRFFEEVVKVFRASKRSVPVFNDKHLAYNWADAKWMYDQSKELGFPMMAGSSVPVTWRKPDLQPERGIEWERALALGYGHPSYAEAVGYHTLEALQVVTERRKGGETGVRAVQYLEGKDAWGPPRRRCAASCSTAPAIRAGSSGAAAGDDSAWSRSIFALRNPRTNSPSSTKP